MASAQVGRVAKHPLVVIDQGRRNQTKPCSNSERSWRRCRHTWRASRRSAISTSQRYALRVSSVCTLPALAFPRARPETSGDFFRLSYHVIAHTSGLQLRDIEILAQQQLEVLEGEGKDDVTLREIQKILYSTEVSVVAVPSVAACAYFPSRKDLRSPKQQLMKRKPSSPQETIQQCCTFSRPNNNSVRLVFPFSLVLQHRTQDFRSPCAHTFIGSFEEILIIIPSISRATELIAVSLHLTLPPDSKISAACVE